MAKKQFNWTILIVLGLIGAGLFFFGEQIKEAFFTQDTGIKILKYDINGNPIRTTYSVVGGEPGVYFISFEIFAKNEGQAPYDFEIIDASPNELANNIDYIKHVDIPPGESVKWTTNLVPTRELENGQDVEFTVLIQGSFECPSGYSCLTDDGVIKAGDAGVQTKEASIWLKIEPDPLMEGGFDVGVTITETEGNFDDSQPSGATTTTISPSGNVVAEGCQASLTAFCPADSGGCQVRRLSATGSCDIDRDIFKGNCAAGESCIGPSSVAYYQIIKT